MQKLTVLPKTSRLKDVIQSWSWRPSNSDVFSMQIVKLKLNRFRKIAENVLWVSVKLEWKYTKYMANSIDNYQISSIFKCVKVDTAFSKLSTFLIWWFPEGLGRIGRTQTQINWRIYSETYGSRRLNVKCGNTSFLKLHNSSSLFVLLANLDPGDQLLWSDSVRNKWEWSS